MKAFFDWLLIAIGIRKPPTFTFMGKVYDARYWEKVPDPSDMPPWDWHPPNHDWDYFEKHIQDKKVVRKDRSK